MSRANSFGPLKASFKRLRDRLGVQTLRAEGQVGGWGPAILKPETSAPAWYFAGADDAQSEFCSIAAAAARAAGYIGPDGWLVWLDLACDYGLARSRNEINATIADVCYASIQLCALAPVYRVKETIAPRSGLQRLTTERRRELAGRIESLTHVERQALADDRWLRVNACLSALKGSTGRATRKDIWNGALRYTCATEFQRWQRADARATKTATDLIEGFLTHHGR